MADDGINPLSSSIARAIHGSKGGGSSRTPIEAPDSLYSTAIARILDLVSEGEIEMWVSDNPLKDIYLDETPVMNADGSLNFQSVQVEYRTGTPDQSYIPGFPSIQSEVAVGVQLEFGTPWVRAINNTQLSAVKLRLAVQALSKTNNSNGDISGHRVDYAIDISTDGGAYEEVFISAFSGKTGSLYERTHRIDLPPANTGWNIRVRRLTPNAADAYTQDKTYIQAITDIIDAKMRYPYSALVGISLDAQQFRSIPRRAYRLKGRIVRVPSNYNPTTRAYTGVWNGTFQLAWTNNPAWIYYDLATNQRYGLGRRVPESRIDKWSLYKIAQYCDELVPDGKGGMEPRFTCTVYLQRASDAYKVMKDLASVFRGISYWAGGAVVALADQPEDPVYTYTNANVKDGKFAYNGTGKKARHTVAMVQYTNVDNFGKGEIEPVIDEEGILRYGIQETNITAFGCTSQGQAQRVGRWLILTELVETDACQWQVGQDGTLVAPGKIVRIMDKDRAGRRLGGRISSADANGIVVDALPDPVPVPGDTLVTITPQGTAQESVIQAVDVPTRRISVSAPFPAVPVAQSVWGIETNDISAQTFRILGVSDNGDGSYGLAGLQHNATKFMAADQGTKIETKPISILPSTVQTAPAEVTLTAVERAGEVLTSILVNADWEPVSGASAYYIQWKRGDGEWGPPEKLTGTSADLENTFPGDHWARVWAVNQSGISSPIVMSNKLVVADQSLKPGFVDALNASIATALETAENAQATADGSVVSFWAASPPIIGSSGGQAKEGDIWFDTDNGNKVHRVVSGAWAIAADDDMAQALAAATTAQATADGKVKTFFGSVAPTAEAVGDLWFNTTTKKLFRWNGSNWNSEIADVTLDQLGGSGVNIMQEQHTRFFSTELPNLASSVVTVAIVAEPLAIGGAYALRATTGGTATNQDFTYFASNGATDKNFDVDPGDYIVSFYASADVAGHTILPTLTFDAGSNAYPNGSSNNAVALTLERTRYAVKITVPAGASRANLLMYWNRAGVAGRQVTIDGLMIERMVGRKVEASVWSPGQSGKLAIDAIAAASAAQDTADGKITTFYQASMPTGSLGDLWFDTDDKNKQYRHNGTTFVVAQDQAIGDAINAAAGAQATADGKVTTFYAASAPVAEAVGDLWYNTTAKNLSRWNGSAWIQVGDITADKLNGAGVNLLNEEYTNFKSSSNLNVSSVPAFYQTTLGQLVSATDAAAIGGHSLRALTAGTGVTSNWAYFGASGTDYNTALEGGKKYLLSFYGKASAAGHQIRFTWVGDDGGAVNFSSAVALTGAYNRYTVELDLTSKTTSSGILLCYFNVSGVDGRYVYLDRLMIEEKIGNGVTPGAWSPGKSWRQTIIAINNAAYAQATADGKITLFKQGTAPESGFAEGDIWIDTDDNKMYVREGAAWVLRQDSAIGQALNNAATAQSTADGKVTTFYQTTTPTAEAEGDLWYNKNNMALKRWNGSAWVDTAPQPAASGSNLVPNSTFIGNSAGVPVANRALYEVIADGWHVAAFTAGAYNYAGRQADSKILLQIGNAPIANGAVAQVRAQNTKPIDVVPTATYLLSVSGTVNWNGSTPPAGVVAESRAYVQWIDGNGAHISYSILSRVRPDNAAAAPLTVVAPATAVQAYVSIDVLVRNNSGATWTHDSTVPINTTFSMVSLVKVNNLDSEVADGNGYVRYGIEDSFVSGGKRRIGMRIAGSGHRIGDQRNLPQSNTAAYGSVRTATALSATSDGVVSVNAHSLRYGGTSVSYSAVSSAVSGLTQGSTYVIYCFDDAYAGGVRTWYAGSNPAAVMALGDGVVVAGQITIPSSGSSSGGGSGDGTDPGEWCVDADMVLPDGRRAGDIMAGDVIPVWDNDANEPGVEYLVVESNTLVEGQLSTIIMSESGAEVCASDCTPMPTRDGRLVKITDLAEGEVVVLQSGHPPRWERVVSVEPVGPRTVAKIRVHQTCYFAGTRPGLTIATHNPQYKP